jgi:hypothetical protein
MTALTCRLVDTVVSNDDDLEGAGSRFTVT